LKERNRLASALFEQRHAEFIAKARASGAVRDQLRQLYAKGGDQAAAEACTKL
jgi:hypothetical protein